MIVRHLAGKRILVIEDEYLLANQLEGELEDAGAIVLGPVATIGGAFALIQKETQIDATILDINLGGEMAFPVADLLIERGVPLMFTTGYDAGFGFGRFVAVCKCEKPFSSAEFFEKLRQLLDRQ